MQAQNLRARSDPTAVRHARQQQLSREMRCQRSCGSWPECDCGALPCVVLRSRAREPQPLSMPCHLLYTQPFDDRQWASVTHTARRRLLTNLNTGLFDLSNNNSINIFHNHARVWQHVVKSGQPTLVLEDDVALRPGAAREIYALVAQIRHTGAPFVLKLFNNNVGWNEMGWSLGVDELACVCDSAWVSTGTAAYYLTPDTAAFLLRHYLPISTHVDVWLWQLACERHELSLYTARNVAEHVTLPSLHRAETDHNLLWSLLNAASVLNYTMGRVWAGRPNASEC